MDVAKGDAVGCVLAAPTLLTPDCVVHLVRGLYTTTPPVVATVSLQGTFR